MPPLQMSLADIPAGILASIAGEAGVAEAEALDRALMAITLRRPALVVLDLSGLAFIASLSMGALLAFQRGLHHHDGHLRVAAPQELVLGAFRRARLDQVLPIYLTVEEALAAP